ncbi:ribonuclease HII [Aureimonas endophytica]|nr:ribonuclease HII [Aureimonas endophytica]
MARRRSDSNPSLFDPVAGKPRVAPDFAFETELRARGVTLVAGVDEAGRGPLAGPVVAAAVILDPASMPAGLNDSKKLTQRARERLFAEILATATVGVASAGPAEIDRLNIRRASLAAMVRAVEALAAAPGHCLIDGIDVPPGLRLPATPLVAGDARSQSIAAASIVAKVLRDRMMVRLGARFPAYGFERHMGYGTKAHLDAIRAHGPCPHHRRSFAPIRNSEAAG